MAVLDDKTFLRLVATVDAANAESAELQRMLQHGRLELAFSRLQYTSASQAGASLLYAPHSICPRAFIALPGPEGLENEIERSLHTARLLLAAPLHRAAPGPRPLRPAAYESPSALRVDPYAMDGTDTDGVTGVVLDSTIPSASVLRRRRGGGGAAEVVDAIASDLHAGSDRVEPTASAINSAGSSSASSRLGFSGADPLTWFGANASPSIAKAQHAFRNALQIAVRLASLRAMLAAHCRDSFPGVAVAGAEDIKFVGSNVAAEERSAVPE